VSATFIALRPCIEKCTRSSFILHWYLEYWGLYFSWSKWELFIFHDTFSPFTHDQGVQTQGVTCCAGLPDTFFFFGGWRGAGRLLKRPKINPLFLVTFDCFEWNFKWWLMPTASLMTFTMVQRLNRPSQNKWKAIFAQIIMLQSQIFWSILACLFLKSWMLVWFCLSRCLIRF
jgi:hypothetical protein